MDVHEALRSRTSVRAFRRDPIPEPVLRRVLEAALHSPSWANTQPYRLALASGADCDRLRTALLDAVVAQLPGGDHPMLFAYPPELQARRRAAGFGLYAALGIERHDNDRREAQYRRNFAFFDAPAVAFLFAHDALGVYGVLDAGCFLQSLLLAATAEGLGMCAQASLASYPHIVRRHFDVPEGYKLLCGVSIGYAAAAPENGFRPIRMTLAELLLPAGDDGRAAAAESALGAQHA